MSDATARARYRANKMRDNGQIFIDDMERGYAIAVMLRNYDVPAEELDANAETVVRGLNAHDPLVEALEKARRDLRDYGAAPIQQVCEEMKRALDEAKP